MCIHNHNWKLLPTIAFVDGYPRLLTWKYHYSGCNLIHIHWFRWITNIISPVSDQVRHAVFKPWTVKHMKVGYNYNGSQMVEQRSSWKGPDTINVSSVWKYYHGYILIQKSQARLYAKYKDMKSLIQRLIDNENLPTIMLKELKSFLDIFQ